MFELKQLITEIRTDRATLCYFIGAISVLVCMLPISMHVFMNITLRTWMSFAIVGWIFGIAGMIIEHRQAKV